MLELLVAAGLEGKPTLEKCKAMKQAKLDKKEQEKLAKKEAKAKHKDDPGTFLFVMITHIVRRTIVRLSANCPLALFSVGRELVVMIIPEVVLVRLLNVNKISRGTSLSNGLRLAS